jgi:hypothetical protein
MNMCLSKGLWQEMIYYADIMLNIIPYVEYI